jgi:hypothetical protein
MDKIELKKDGNLWVCKIEDKEYGFRKLTWGEKNKITEISQKIGPNGQPYFSMAEFNVNFLLGTLKKAPFQITRESLEAYPDAKIIDICLKIATDMNIASPPEIQNL